MGNFCYSWNGEDYSARLYDTEKEAMKDAKEDRPDAKEVWIGTATKPNLKWNSNEEYILESMQDSLEDDCGEYAECGLDSITNEQELDLAKMIDEAVEKWIEKHEIESLCYVVLDGRLREIKE